jgi:hypothetical protein
MSINPVSNPDLANGQTHDNTNHVINKVNYFKYSGCDVPCLENVCAGINCKDLNISLETTEN